jgi:hypothetical protein
MNEKTDSGAVISHEEAPLKATIYLLVLPHATTKSMITIVPDRDRPIRLRVLPSPSTFHCHVVHPESLFVPRRRSAEVKLLWVEI